MMPSRKNKSKLLRERIFTVLALLLPVIFFVVLEAGLRVAGYGDNYPLFQPVAGYEDYLYPNPSVARRYFSQQESVPSIPFDAFRREKDDATVRIFVQGGSSAAGYPYYFGGGFSDMLEQRLLQSYPGRNVEIVNTSMAAVNSYTLLDLTDEIIEQEPDAVLIYAGHNEYYGALGVASAESFGRLRPTKLAYLKLERWRTVQLLRETIAWFVQAFGGRRAGEAPGTTLMARMVGEQSIPYQSELFEQGVRQFSKNLAAILERYQDASIPVFVATVVSNVRDQRPFVSSISASTDSAGWHADFRAALDPIRTSSPDTAEALSRLERLIERHGNSADAWFAIARLLDVSGRYADARPAYYAAKDRDELRFRAPEAINEALIRVTSEHGGTVVDVKSAFEAQSEAGVTGNSLMTEHLHPNVDGFFIIADAFYEALMESEVLGSGGQIIPRAVARRQVLFTEVDSLVGSYRLRLLKGSWPFVPLGTSPVPLDLTPGTVPESLAVAVFEERISRIDALDQLRTWHLYRRDAPGALKAALAMIQRYPFLTKPHLAAGDILVAQGALDAALSYYEVANDRRENAQSYRMIGSILLRKGQREEAIAYLERSIEMEPDNTQALYNLAGAYSLSMESDKAREALERLLEISPGHQEGRKLLESLP